MASFLLDTHTWSWNLTEDPRLPLAILRMINTAERIYVSPVSVYEIVQKVRLNKWPEMAAYAPALPDLLAQQKGYVAELNPSTAALAASLDWDHRDPFDRIIAASAMMLKLPLLSADIAFDQLSGRGNWPGRVW
ncbi:type II toxin-antitoxin system VapC family toxin [Rhizobium sp.]